MNTHDINPELRAYVEQSILPLYDGFDAAHQREHALMVIGQSLAIIDDLRSQGEPVDPDMAYATAAYHDTGLTEGRATHHLASGRIVRADSRLRQWFTAGQIETMAQAVEDHRASATTPPRSIYGRIVAEADRMIDPELVVQRTIQYGLDHYPGLSREEHYRRTVAHLHEKYGRQGYLKLWFANSPNAPRLECLRQLIDQPTALRALFDRQYPALMKQ